MWSDIIGRKWDLAVVTSIIVNVFEHNVIILAKEVSYHIYRGGGCFKVLYI